MNNLAADAGFAGVERQANVGGESWLGRVDFLLTGTNVLLEAQSDTYHASLSSRRDDERRFAALERTGFLPLAIWEKDIWYRPELVVRTIRAAALVPPA
ncbi:MAG: hypothetical protein V3V01_18565 [Acidimicrobiales bacterium]